jgi:hypothetical protein
MEQHFALFFGAMLVATAMTASHPIRPQTIELLGERLSANWHELETHPLCAADRLDACQPQMAIP